MQKNNIIHMIAAADWLIRNRAVQSAEAKRAHLNRIVAYSNTAKTAFTKPNQTKRRTI